MGGETVSGVMAPLPERVLSLAYYPPLAGHHGPDKTVSRTLDRFYWAGIWAQVQQFCSICRECQLQQGKSPQGGLLHPMPLVSIPFERVGIDIAGPLTQSASHHKYLLVLIGYATRIP